MSLQSEIGQIQELLDMRVDLIARIQCLYHMEKDHLIESNKLIEVMTVLFLLTGNEIYQI